MSIATYEVYAYGDDPEVDPPRIVFTEVEGAIVRMSGRTTTRYGRLGAMDTNTTDYDPNFTPEEPSEPGSMEELSPDALRLSGWLRENQAPPEVADAYGALMRRLNSAEDELALERLRADSLAATAIGLRDQHEKLRATVMELAEVVGMVAQDERQPDPGEVHEEDTVGGDTSDEPAEPGEETEGDQAPFEGDK